MNIDQCAVCGSPVEDTKNGVDAVCIFCCKTVHAARACSAGHVVCDGCRTADPVQLIEGTIFTSSAKNSFMIAELLMNHPSLPMLGCEHALIAAGSLLVALKNSPYGAIGDNEMREAFSRIRKLPQACSCDLTGICSIAPAIGACFSIFLLVRPGSDREQKIVMDAVIRVSSAIADLTGPVCCKAYVRASLETASTFFAERLGIALPNPSSPLICRHHATHPHGCREEKCPYFRKEKNSYEESIHLKMTVCHS